MHYDGTAFADDDRAYTMLDKRTNEPVERNYELSPQDFELLNKIYPGGDAVDVGTVDNGTVDAGTVDAQALIESNDWILVLNTRGPSQVPIIIDGMGQSKTVEFAYGLETQANQACSITWHGKLFFFGGHPNPYQISVVDGCQLTKKGKLPFKMNAGACAQRDNNEIFICFEDYYDRSTWKNCRRSNGPLEAFSELPTSTYDHRSTRVAVTSGKTIQLSKTQFSILLPRYFQSTLSLLVAMSQTVLKRSCYR